MSKFEDEELLRTKQQVLRAVIELNDDQQSKLERWINSAQYKKDVEAMRELEKQESQLEEVAEDLRAELGVDGEVGSEHLLRARSGDLADCEPEHTLHVDEFLCDDTLLDQLVSEGALSRHYCTRCNSKKVQELTLISHSAGRRYLRYMFKYLLPAQMHGMQLLDVGSRIGAVLYGAYYLTDASKIVGVEMNAELCKIQEQRFARFHMDPTRVSVVHSDLLQQGELLRSSDVVVFNVVDLFVDEDRHVAMWRLLKARMRPGASLLTMRSVPDSLSGLGADVVAEFVDWLEVERPHQAHNELLLDPDDVDTDVYLYKVK